MRYRTFRKKYLRSICRDCLNEETGLKFKSVQCGHHVYPTPCAKCEDMRNVIIAIKPRAMWKVWFHFGK